MAGKRFRSSPKTWPPSLNQHDYLPPDPNLDFLLLESRGLLGGGVLYLNALSFFKVCIDLRCPGGNHECMKCLYGKILIKKSFR